MADTTSTNRDPGAPAAPTGKAIQVAVSDAGRPGAETRRMLDALEDDAVREALKSREVGRTTRRK